jgi:hypothetical protein
MSVSKVLKKILLDQPYYGEEGGLTVSGGEPLLQKEFVQALFAKVRQNGIMDADDYGTVPLPADFSHEHLEPEQAKYGIVPGIGSDSHFAGDYSIGLSLGWGGLLEANENPALHPDLVVRVTGFTAYFAALSPEFRQLVVNRFVVISPSKRPGGPVYYGSHLRKNYGPL